MNLFENILKNSAPKGINPVQDFMSGFTPTKQPTQVVQPQRPTMSLFSDEKEMYAKMKADNLPDETAFAMLKKRRTDLLGGNTKLSPDEQSMLLKMQADNIPAKQATAMIQKRRADQFQKKYDEGNILQKGAYNALMLGAGNLETTLKYGGNILDFATLGKAGFGEDVKRMEQVTQSPEFDSTARKIGSYLPDVALSVSPIGGSFLAGAKGMTNLALRSGVVGAGFGATQPILDKGSEATIEDIAAGGAIGAGVGVVATPVISKALKYGQAGYYGGVTGMGKSISRDIKGGVQAITPSGANISTRANRFNANEIREFMRTTGQSPGDFATSRGMTKVGDDAVVEATNLWKKSMDQADEGLQAIKGRFRFTNEGEDLLKTTMDDLETRLINTKSPDAKRISQLKAKYESSGLTMSEINEVKRLYSNNYKYSFVDAGSEGALRSRNLQDAIRKWQFKVAEENGLTNLKEINKTTQGWKMFADSLSKKIRGSSGNNNVSLTDWIALSGGGPENIALYLGKKLASSDLTKRTAIKLFSKQTKPSIIQASKADIQQANFLKDVNRGVSGIGDNSGGKSLVRPVGLLPAPSGKATGARNVRVNQPKEKSPIINEGQKGNRPQNISSTTPLKSSPKVNVPKKAESKPIVKKEAVKAKPLAKKLTPTKKSDTIGDMENTKLYKPGYEREAKEIIGNKTDAELKSYLKELDKNSGYWMDKGESGYRQFVEDDVIRYYLEKKSVMDVLQNSDILKKIQSSYKEGKSIIDLDKPERQMYFDGFTIIDGKPMVKISEVGKFYGSKLKQKDSTISPDEFMERYKYVGGERETKSISKKLKRAELDDSNIMKRYYREDYKKALEGIKKKTP